MYQDATILEIDQAMAASQAAFKIYRCQSLAKRAELMRAIAAELELHSQELLETAALETNLSFARLKIEWTRTLFQWRNYAKACEEGLWLDARIDQGDKSRQPAKPDLRKTRIPLGPVIVFGASNFPFAYSTPGGDAACALAAGCTVVIKGHPAHAATSHKVAGIIRNAIAKQDLPKDIFAHIHGASFDTGKILVQHPLAKAVGFTGSFAGGKALWDLANARPVPIPVFAEMGSVNPVYLLPEKLRENIKAAATMYAQSMLVSVGQFCTNPGLFIALNDETTNDFKKELGKLITAASPAKMLHSGISKSFHQKREETLAQKDVHVIATSTTAATAEESIPTLAEVSASAFLQNPLLHQEVFGPFSILITCDNDQQMLDVARSMEGQLTCTILATDSEINNHQELIQTLQETCGRLVLNGVPTGVEVTTAMHHGGPYPASTDSRFTAVGADGIQRFARPFCYQNWPDELLPDELKNENPLGIWRLVNGNWQR